MEINHYAPFVQLRWFLPFRFYKRSEHKHNQVGNRFELSGAETSRCASRRALDEYLK
jgi:hypothetical protein